MSQRSYSNERYRKGAKVGSTRKSAAGAKPVRKLGSAASTSTPAKSKPKLKDSGVEKDWSGLPTSPEIKKWRRVWWVLLLGGLALIGGSYAIPDLRANDTVLRVVSATVLAFSMIAVTIDLVVIRKLRKELMAVPSKKSKHADAPKTAAAKGSAEKGAKVTAETGTDAAQTGKDAT